MSEYTAQVEHQEGISIIRLAGYLSSENAGELEEAFERIGDAEKVLLVFREQDMISSAGLAVLFDLIFPLKEQGKEFRIVQPSKHFRKVFDIIGLSKDVEVFETEEPAVAGW